MAAGTIAISRSRHVSFVCANARDALNLSRRGMPLAREWAASSSSTAPDIDDAAGGENDVFLSALFFRAGLRASAYRPCSLRRRLPACLRALRAENAAHARWLVRRSPHLVPVALEALLLGVTEFFRDARTFDCLAEELRTPVASGRRLRVWSAGCSDGAELYSVAILLDEMNALGRCELLGTDFREDAVRRAACGAFAEPTLRGVSPERLMKYFDAGSSRVSAQIRDRVTWRPGNLLAGVEPGPWDVILCRNFAMYLHEAAAARLWRNLAEALRPGGLLVVGKAERPGPSAGVLSVGPSVYQRYGEP